MERLENIEKLGVLLNALEGRTKATTSELVQLFNLHNYFNPNKPEWSKHCNSCVVRVYKKCKQMYENLKNEL
jgi:hypothetical protein